MRQAFVPPAHPLCSPAEHTPAGQPLHPQTPCRHSHRRRHPLCVGCRRLSTHTPRRHGRRLPRQPHHRRTQRHQQRHPRSETRRLHGRHHAAPVGQARHGLLRQSRLLRLAAPRPAGSHLAPPRHHGQLHGTLRLAPLHRRCGGHAHSSLLVGHRCHDRRRHAGLRRQALQSPPHLPLPARQHTALPPHSLLLRHPLLARLRQRNARLQSHRLLPPSLRRHPQPPRWSTPAHLTPARLSRHPQRLHRGSGHVRRRRPPHPSGSRRSHHHRHIRHALRSLPPRAELPLFPRGFHRLPL